MCHGVSSMVCVCYIGLCSSIYRTPSSVFIHVYLPLIIRLIREPMRVICLMGIILVLCIFYLFSILPYHVMIVCLITLCYWHFGCLRAYEDFVVIRLNIIIRCSLPCFDGTHIWWYSYLMVLIFHTLNMFHFLRIF